MKSLSHESKSSKSTTKVAQPKATQAMRTLFRLKLKRTGIQNRDGSPAPAEWWHPGHGEGNDLFPTKRAALDAGDALVEANPKYVDSKVIQERWPAFLTFSNNANQIIRALRVVAGDDAALDAEFRAYPALWAEFRERAIPLLEKSLERLRKSEAFNG